MVTIKDIAAELGINYTTVSKCLNNDPKVSDVTKEKVRETAERMGFAFNANARNLSRKSTNNIGVIFSNEYYSVQTRWFYSEIEMSLAPSLERSGFEYIIQPYLSINKQSKVRKLVSERIVDGLIIATRDISKADIEFLRKNKIPYVFLLMKPEELEEQPELFIGDDNFAGGYIAAEHLIDMGHNRILTITADHEPGHVYKDRTSGYIKAMEEHGLQPDILKCSMNFDSIDDIKEKLGTAIHEYTGLFIQQDIIAMKVLVWLKELGIQVPGDISIVGYNNVDFISYFDVHMTTIDDRRAELAKAAVDRLIHLIKKEEVVSQSLFVPRLIKGNTVKRRGEIEGC